MGKGQQAFIYQANNLVPDMAITHAISPSARTPLVYPVAKQGTGNIKIQGAYTGAVDKKIEVRISDLIASNPVVSAPVFRGAGTGKLKDIAAQGLPAQTIKVICLSTGVTTSTAQIEIAGILFRAKASGAAGNNIVITIDDTGLVYTEAGYSTIKPLSAGETEREGQEWDFDCKSLQNGLIPAAAHRISFGADKLHIYRQYSRFENGVTKYCVVPAIHSAVKEGTKVYFVTGARSVTVTNGVVTEVYDNIVTAADLWNAIRTLPSELLEPVSGAIDISMTPESPAVREFALKTSAYALSPYAGDSSSKYAGTLESVVVNANTKTELIEIKCADNTTIGGEIWDVRGSQSGSLCQCRTGQYNEFGPIGFTVPQRFPDNWGAVNEDWSYKPEYASRQVDPPFICLKMKLGINASPQTLTLTYKRRPASCVCPDISFDDGWLGLEEEGGEIGMSYTVPDLRWWLKNTFEIMREKYKSSSITTYGGHESNEGRDTAVQNAQPYTDFARSTREYFKDFEDIAARIMALPENVPDDLTAMVNNFKTLVNSLTLMWTTASMQNEATWNGSQWSSDAMTYIDDVRYNVTARASLVDSILLYERTHGVKKK